MRPVRDSSESPDPDHALVRAVAGGDRVAFRRLHDRYYTRVYRLAVRLVQRSDRAAEVANDTMLAVWRGASGFEGNAKVSTWVFGIVYRQSLKTRRFFRRESWQVEIADRVDIADDTAVPIEVFFERRRVVEAVSRLPLPLRAIVELTYYDDLSYAEIARIVGCPEGTVKSRMSRARVLLRAELEKGSNP